MNDPIGLLPHPKMPPLTPLAARLFERTGYGTFRYFGEIRMIKKKTVMVDTLVLYASQPIKIPEDFPRAKLNFARNALRDQWDEFARLFYDCVELRINDMDLLNDECQAREIGGLMLGYLGEPRPRHHESFTPFWKIIPLDRKVPHWPWRRELCCEALRACLRRLRRQRVGLYSRHKNGTPLDDFSRAYISVIDSPELSPLVDGFRQHAHTPK